MTDPTPPIDAMGTGRPMGRGWIAVPRQHIADDAALTFWVQTGIDSGR